MHENVYAICVIYIVGYFKPPSAKSLIPCSVSWIWFLSSAVPEILHSITRFRIVESQTEWEIWLRCIQTNKSFCSNDIKAWLIIALASHVSRGKNRWTESGGKWPATHTRFDQEQLTLLWSGDKSQITVSFSNLFLLFFFFTWPATRACCYANLGPIQE